MLSGKSSFFDSATESPTFAHTYYIIKVKLFYKIHDKVTCYHTIYGLRLPMCPWIQKYQKISCSHNILWRMIKILNCNIFFLFIESSQIRRISSIIEIQRYEITTFDIENLYTHNSNKTFFNTFAVDAIRNFKFCNEIFKISLAKQFLRPAFIVLIKKKCCNRFN